MERESTRTITDLENLGQAWATAELHGDVGFLDRTLAADFVGIGPRGFLLTKEQWLARLTSGDLRYQGFTWDEVAVRSYGDAAVATGRWTQEGTHKGQDVSGQFRATQVFLKQNGQWLLAGLHLSPIGEFTIGR